MYNNVRKKIITLTKQFSITKTKLGEVLGAKGSNQNKITIATSFLSDDMYRLSVKQLHSLAKFFDRPVTYFFDNEQVITLANNRHYHTDNQHFIEEIRNNMQKLGLDGAYIEASISQMKAIKNIQENVI